MTEPRDPTLVELFDLAVDIATAEAVEYCSYRTQVWLYGDDDEPS